MSTESCHLLFTWLIFNIWHIQRKSFLVCIESQFGANSEWRGHWLESLSVQGFIVFFGFVRIRQHSSRQTPGGSRGAQTDGVFLDYRGKEDESTTGGYIGGKTGWQSSVAVAQTPTLCVFPISIWSPKLFLYISIISISGVSLVQVIIFQVATDKFVMQCRAIIWTVARMGPLICHTRPWLSYM